MYVSTYKKCTKGLTRKKTLYFKRYQKCAENNLFIEKFRKFFFT